MAKLKYLQIIHQLTPPIRKCLEEVPRRGGMYNWIFLFKGTIMPINEVTPKIIEDFDVVQVNLAPVDQILVKKIKKMIPKSSSTLLIGNNDYTAESWDTWLQHPLEYMGVQDDCDGIFGTEYYQVSHLRDDAYIIPHPHWISMLKHIGNDDTVPTNVGCIYHWWEGKTYTQSLILEKLRKYHKVHTRIYGYNKSDKNSSWTRVMFDKIMPMMDYPSFQRSMQTNKFIFENCSYHTYGRTSVDCAALRIPCVGSDRVMSMRRCFPNMSFDPYDCKNIVNTMRKIMSNSSWVDKQIDIAYDACEYFNYKNSEKRYMNMVDGIRDKVGK